MLSDSEEFMNHYVENIEHITLLGNGNEKLSKVDKKVEILEERNKELEDKLADLKERHDK